jgi:hypothetical protein
MRVHDLSSSLSGALSATSRPSSTADLMRNVFLGPGARLANYIENDSGRVVVRESVAGLREGQMLVLSP